MSEMRIVVAGAGGRMGRTLVRSVGETSGLTLAGATEEPSSRFIGHIIGTTGFTPDDEAAIKAAAQKAVIVKSGNMSLGVNLLAALVRRVAKTLDTEFDIEVLEMHHRNKIDAPSGTSLLLGRAAAKGRDMSLEKHWVKARDGHNLGPRADGSIGFATLRGGSVVGEHSVIFAGTGERITLSHSAEDRS